jgi:hypothetical protein
MKTKTFLALFAIAALAIAQAPPTYAAEEAAKHVGETATVKDRVDGFHQSGKGNIFLNMGGKYPKQPSQRLSLLRAPRNSLSCNNTKGERFRCQEKLLYITASQRLSSGLLHKLAPSNFAVRSLP